MSNMSINGSGKQSTPTMSTAGSYESTHAPKISTPETFDGTKEKLENFQLQVQLYLHFNAHQFHSEADKVLYAASFLRGRAARGFRAYLKDWLVCQNSDDEPETETRRIFHSYDKFEEKLNDLYGIPNEEAHADRHIRQLRQTTSVAAYASEFQGYQADLEWNDAAYRSQFYLGLKDSVKAELSRNSSMTTLGAMIKAAKEIDERLQELRYDRIVQPGHRIPARGGGGGFKARSQDPDYGDPMELDATERTRGRKLKSKGFTCYECGEEGHYARNCRKKNKVSREMNTMARTTAYRECEEDSSKSD